MIYKERKQMREKIPQMHTKTENLKVTKQLPNEQEFVFF